VLLNITVSFLVWMLTLTIWCQHFRQSLVNSLVFFRTYIQPWLEVYQYGIPALFWSPGKHIGTSFMKKVMQVCFTSHFVRFMQPVADVCTNQWPK